MSKDSKLQQFLKIMEGELIPTKVRTLKIDTDPYTLYRTLLRMPSPENYIQPNGNRPMGLMTFWDSVSYANAKDKFDKFGIKYEEQDEGMSHVWDNEHEHNDVFNVSPVATNGAVGNDMRDWTKGSSTVKSVTQVKQGHLGKNTSKTTKG